MRIFGRRWFQIFGSGLVLLYLVERTLVHTGNPNYVPSVILLGAFLVPVAFTTYLYETMPGWDVPFPPLAACFLWGGVLGTVVAGALEYHVAVSLGFLPKLGIVLGVASAMGFAALETMGYGFVTLIQSRGDLGALDAVLLVRGLTSPAGHAAWTGLVCAVLWRERLKAGRAVLNGHVVGAFMVAVGLHTLWDVFASFRGVTFVDFLSVEMLSLLVAVMSLTLLIRRVREARREATASVKPG